MIKFRKITVILFLGWTLSAVAQEIRWPEVSTDMKPGTRWWWLGSAVDRANLTYNLEEYAKAGMGSVEITPIYGVQNNDANNIDFLSKEWMEILRHTISETERLGMHTDMNMGTGWPFGGPEVTLQQAASKLFVRRWQVEGPGVFKAHVQAEERNQQDAPLLRLMAFQGKRVINITNQVDASGNISWKAPKGNWDVIATFNGKTFQKVKRAAPGGDGYVIDHFSKKAVETYFEKFDEAFTRYNTPYPHDFFNDSYEVYGADWTEDFFEQFQIRRGYALENWLPLFLSSEASDQRSRLVSDYRETIAELLLENFTQQWSQWAHERGSQTRNQAHGSPGNLIDLYAAVDVPECEGFGLSDFNIPGLRKDSLTRKNDSDLSMLKYASSAAHITGKPLVSSETFTWLTEHFRTSLSQTKPDLDLMFISGVNHMNFHGSPYSPKEAEWPGWLFYATVNMTPTNTIWKDAPALFDYITRSQSFLQKGQPDSDFLLYLPVYDVWHDQQGRFLQFDIHSMERRMPGFIHAVHAIYENGFDVDYISDQYIMSTQFNNGMLVTQGGVAYKALVLPAVRRLPEAVLRHVLSLTQQGATVVFLENVPMDIPGLSNYAKRKKAFDRMVRPLQAVGDFSQTRVTPYGKGKFITGADYNETLLAIGVPSEEMITVHGLHALRRSNDTGHHYFISGLQDKPVDGWVKLAVKAQSAVIFDPMTGAIGKAQVRQQGNSSEVYLQVAPGASRILQTYAGQDVQYKAWDYIHRTTPVQVFDRPWTLHFEESAPAIKDTFTLSSPVDWTTLDHPDLQKNSGTGIYSTTFRLNKQAGKKYILQLGDVRESARVWLNGREVTTVWAVPFECRVESFLKDGENSLRIEVTNLPANRIADYDRRNVNWRIFNEINMVDIRYRKSDYSNWSVMESGLLQPVQLVIAD